MNALSISASGMTAAAQRFDASARRTAAGGADPVSETVEQVSAKSQFEASAAVVRTADKMMGVLLDMKA